MDGIRIIGLTGGIASGKSAAAAILRELGVPVVDADRLGRDVLAKDSVGLKQVIQYFGAEFLHADGTLNRRRLAAHVFEEPEERQKLEELVHPLIRHAAEKEFKILAAQGHQIAFYEAALLVESGLHKNFDSLLLIASTRENQLSRMMLRDGISKSEAEGRLAAQAPLAAKRSVADTIIENDGSLEELRQRVEAYWKEIKQ